MLSLNHNKTTDMIIKLSSVVTEVNPAVKFLGVYIDPNLGWHSHTNYVTAKVTKIFLF